MRYILPLLLSVLMLSCNQENGEPNQVFKDTLPGSNGGRLDVIVVAKDALYDQVAGETLRKYFTRQQDGLPQALPVFNVRQVDPSEFNELLKRSRNIIILEEGDSSFFSVRRNVYAKPQRVVSFVGEDEKEIAKLINANHSTAEEAIMRLEIAYLQQRLLKKTQKAPEVVKQHNATIEIPVDYELENETDQVAVYWKKGVQSDMGILIHFEPLSEESTMLGNNIIPLRDSLTKLYVPGENEGSYMQVEQLLIPTIENTEIDDHFALETRGLWKVTNDFMGGSFINYTVYDEINNQKITLDGFVYAPELNKRNLLLELEAILRSFKTVN